MGYLPTFVEDVFISYAHNDDDAYSMESQGWVAQLGDDLKKRVAVFLDGQKPAVWRDREVRSNEDFAEKITGRLLNTATFLSIISPSFFQRQWCLRELEEFAASAERNLGIKIGDKNRIFKVEKVPLSVDRSRLPLALQGTGSYRFYGPDPEHQGKIHEYRPKLGVDYAAKYWREMDDLAQDIAMVLKQMSTTPAAAESSTAAAMTVFLAETTSDLDDEAKEIRRDLKARGFTVLPEGDLPYRNAKDLKARLSEYLQKSVLSIHLVGNEYGSIPEGENDKSSAWLQMEYVMLHQCRDSNFGRVMWMPPGLSPSNVKQQQFIEYLNNDSAVQAQADLLETKLEDLKTVIYEKIKNLRDKQEKKIFAPPEKAADTSPTADRPLRVYVIGDQLDLHSTDLGKLKKFLFSQGYECILPCENADERDALQEHADNLEICDACIIYYGQGSDRWFATKLRELRKFLSSRSQPVLAKAVYVAPPETACKTELETLEAIVLRGSDVFSGDVLTPFLNRLRPTANRAKA